MGKQGSGREKRCRIEKDKGGKGPRAASQAGAQDHGRIQMIHRGDDEEKTPQSKTSADAAPSKQTTTRTLN